MNAIVPRVLHLLRSLFLSALLSFSAYECFAQNIDFGKSYINVTKGLNGGTVETGDTLEIRASFVVRSGTYDSCGYFDAIPAGTTYIPGTVRVLTNEGKIYKQFTDATGDDPGWRTGATIRINLGYVGAAAPATTFRRGRVANTHKPSFYGSTCIMVASFRVRVTAATGSNISTGGGSMTYKLGAAALQTFTFPSNTIRVYPNYGICSNTIGVNAIGTESNGTFSSGRPRNRGTSPNVPVGYTYNVFDLNMPNDYYYGIANNTSTRPNYTTLNTWPKPDPSSPTHRVFSVWDIIGDHTGATSPSLGNPAADTVANGNAGYMLVINAAYRIDSAFQQTISGLCPNTYYEISCWMRNICSKCGCDSNGKGASNTGGPIFYIPTASGDSSGVYPNLTFDIDGIDYYTTGNLRYNGLWVKKGFTFLTGPTQTSFTLKFFNNAPGGGGNDWALDDISVSTCSPIMSYSPTTNPIVCDSNTIIIRDTVRSFFNNYVYYKWQRSTDGGVIWNDITAPAGPASPVWNGSAWEYVVAYTIPPAWTTMMNNGDRYRLVVATTMTNMSDPNCRFTDGGNVIVLKVIECGSPLAVRLLTFTGRLNSDRAILNWSTSKEDEPVYFDIERSIDGNNFISIATINSYNNYSAELNTYSFTDPEALTGKAWYRIRIWTDNNWSAYSWTILLMVSPDKFSFVSVINPFSNELRFDIFSMHDGMAYTDLIDQSGRIVRKHFFEISNGINQLILPNTTNLASGVYLLHVQSGGFLIQKRIVKQNN